MHRATAAASASGGAPAAVSVSCVIEEAPADADPSPPAAADGDTAALSYSAFALTTVPSAKPTDVFKAPPVSSNAQQAARSVDEGARAVIVTAAPGMGLARCARGLRVGDRRLVLVPLAELMSAGDADATNMAPGAALTISRGAYVIVEVSVLRLKAAPPPAQAAAEEAPSAAAPASGPSGSLAAPPPLHESDADGRARAESSLRDRMARLAMAGRPGGTAALPAMSNAASGAAEVRAAEASAAKHHAADESSPSTAIQRYRGESDVDDAVTSFLGSGAAQQSRGAPEPAPATPAPAPAPAPVAAAPEPSPAAPVAASTPQQQFFMQQQLQQQQAAAAMMGGMMHPMMMMPQYSPYGLMSPPAPQYAMQPQQPAADTGALKALTTASEGVQVGVILLPSSSSTGDMFVLVLCEHACHLSPLSACRPR